MSTFRLKRVAFTTSRLAEFCGERELVAQTGHAIDDWALVILKELVDNALDACEEAEIAPEIDIKVSTDTGEIVIADNGSGLPSETIDGVLDYTVRVSSREAYVSPSRGQQGNALKCIIAMPFALDGDRGTTVIEARGLAHRITFEMDPVRRVPRISPACEGIARAAKAGSPIAQKKIERMKKKRAGPQQPTMGPTLFDVFGGGET